MKTRRILISAAKAFISAVVGTFVAFNIVGEQVNWKLLVVSALIAGVKAAWKWLDLLVQTGEPGA